MIRAESATLDALKKYRDEVIRHPKNGLVAFQKERNIKLTFDDMLNFDESQIDINDFTKLGNYLTLDGWPEQIITEYERCPHFTIIIGFIGPILMNVLLIRIGSEYISPHPYHSELLKGKKIFIAQSATGWVNTKLKTEYMQLQYKDADVPIGNRPSAGNADGHTTNTSNVELTNDLIENEVRTT